MSNHGIRLETDRIYGMQAKAEKAEKRFVWDRAFNEAKHKARYQTEQEAIRTWQAFLRGNPGNSHIPDAESILGDLRAKVGKDMQMRYDRHLATARLSLSNKQLAESLEALDAAEAILNEAENELGVGLREADILELRKKHRTEAGKRRDYVAWRKADTDAKRISLNDTEHYDRRIAIYQDFKTKWPGNPYVGNAGKTVASLKEQKAHFMNREFHKYLSWAREMFIAKEYSVAYASLDTARKYATSAQIHQIETLAKRYNAPPTVRISEPGDSVDWEVPVIFSFEAHDPENDPVRVVKWDFGDGKSSSETKPRHTFAKWDGSDKKRLFTITLTVTDGHSSRTVTKTLTVKKQDKIKTYTVNGVSFKMVKIPSGSFMMGSPSRESGRYGNETQHRVAISRSFYMGETEVTQGLWKAVMGNNPSYFEYCGGKCPVEQVSWFESREFIKKLNRILGERFRLPTEAEWEYAARAGTTTPFAFGNCLSTSQANYDGNYPLPSCSKGRYRKKTVQVKRLSPNAWGLYDMHGNVWEWCQDWYGDYPRGSVTDPTGPVAGSYRVLRGSSWDNLARNCRSANRLFDDPDKRSNSVGFRLVLRQGHE